MGKEIERKYLVLGNGWGPGDDRGVRQRQGYLAVNERGTVRVRVEGGRAVLTLKGAQRGLTRAEYEYEIPLEEGEAILAELCGFVVEKTRHRRDFAGRTWEVDVFHGENEGLVVAEVELESEDDAVEAPTWVGAEVSHDPRYRVSHLSKHPYRDWKEDG